MRLPEDLNHYRAPRLMRCASVVGAALAGALSAFVLAALGQAIAERLWIESAHRPFYAMLLETSTKPAELPPISLPINEEKKP